MRALSRGARGACPSQVRALSGGARGACPSQVRAHPIRKFNPGTLQTDTEIIEQFVVRHREFGILRDILERNAFSSTCQHMLVVGPRGRGKTMLLARAAAELHTSETLQQKLLPVRFTEESYEVFDVGDFWLDALFHLAPEAAHLDAELSVELRAAHTEFSRRWHGRDLGRDLEEHARGVVLDAANRLGRKLVLMVENCQSLFDDVDERFGWSLRKTLQTEPNIVFLGSATTRMAALSDVDGPFYEFFRQLPLAPLPLGECKALWEMVSGQVRSEREIRPLQILTGGDPRLLAIISGFAKHRSLKELLQELVSLIDDHTEYFRSHLEGLGKTERRVYLALVDLWQPSTTAEIAARSRQDIRAVSSLLGRLVKRGAVAHQGSSKKRLYEPTQRLYSIYYKLRRQRDEAVVVRSLIQWMVAFFARDDLSMMSGMLADEAMQSTAVRSGLLAAVRDSAAIRDALPAVSDRLEYIEVAQLNTEALEQVGIDPSAALENCQEVLRRLGDEVASPFVAVALGIKAMAHGRLGNTNDQLAAYDDLLGRFIDVKGPVFHAATCMALCDKAIALVRMDRADEAIRAWNGAAARIGSDLPTDVVEYLTIGLYYKAELQVQLHRSNDALATIDHLATSFAPSTIGTTLHEANWTKARALMLKGERQLALHTLRQAYEDLSFNLERTAHHLLHHVPQLVGCGFAERDLIDVLSSDSEKRTLAVPIITVLRQRIGEKVRVPAEVRESAVDMAEHIDQVIAKVRNRFRSADGDQF